MISKFEYEIRDASPPEFNMPLAFLATFFIAVAIASWAFIDWLGGPFVPLLLNALLVIFLLIWSYVDRRNHKSSSQQFSSTFICPKCECKISGTVPYEAFEEAPVLYPCEDCHVLWYAGRLQGF